MDGNGRGLIQGTIPAFDWRGGEKPWKPFHDSQCPSQYLNWKPLEYKSIYADLFQMPYLSIVWHSRPRRLPYHRAKGCLDEEFKDAASKQIFVPLIGYIQFQMLTQFSTVTCYYAATGRTA
jgi:hypothetical protein